MVTNQAAAFEEQARETLLGSSWGWEMIPGWFHWQGPDVWEAPRESQSLAGFAWSRESSTQESSTSEGLAAHSVMAHGGFGPAPGDNDSSQIQGLKENMVWNKNMKG